MSSHQLKFIRRASTGITLGRSNSAYSNGVGGSYSIGWSSGGATANGTWLIAIVEESTDSGSHPYISGGSAWTRLGSTKCYYKQAGSSEPTTYSISYAGSSKSEGSAVTILELFGASSVESTANSSATNASPSVTSTNAGDCVVLAAGYGTSGLGSFTPPSGWTSQSSVIQNAATCIAAKLNAGVETISPGNWNTTFKKLYALAFKP